MKKKVLYTLTTAAIAVAAFFIGYNANENTNNFYLKTAIVTEIENETDTVVVEDSIGNEWAFNGIEDWKENDICSMVMDTNGTESIYDDIIVSTRYDGTTENMVDMDKVTYFEVTDDGLMLYYEDGTGYYWGE